MKRKSKATAKTNKDTFGNRRKQDAHQPSYLVSLITNISDALISTDMEFHIIEWNPAAEKMYGWTAAEVTGHSLVDFVRTEYAGITREEIIRTVLEKGIWKGEVTHECKDGTRIPVMASVSLVRDEAGQPAGFITINRDVTEYKRAEEEIASLARFPSENPNPILRISQKGILLYANSASQPVLKLWMGRVGSKLPEHIVKIVSEVLQAGSPKEREFDCEGQVFSMIFAPIAAAGYVNGYGRDITEHKRAEDKLRENEERLRLSLHAANQGLYDLNVQTGETIVNSEYAEMLGYDPQTFVETNAAWIERLHPDDREATAKAYADYINGLLPEYRVEFRQRMKDCNWKWILSLGKVIEYDAEGKPLRMLGTHTDITERKQAEEALRESEFKFRSLYESLIELSAIHEIVYDSTGKAVDYRILDCNPAFEKITGIQRQQAIGALASQLYETSQPPYLDIYLKVAETGEPASFETEFAPMGKTFNISVFSPQRGRFVTVALDITERKRAEDAIKLSEARYRSLVETQADVVARSDTAGILIFANDSYCQVFGLSREQAIGMDFTLTVLPEDLPAILETREALYNPPYRKYIETRNVTPRGVRWFGWDNSAVRDEKGNVIEFQGVGHDITERKQAEERIKTQLERLASLRAIDTAIISSTNLSMTFYILLTQAITRLKIDAASILLFDPVTNELEVCARQGFYAPDFRMSRVRIGKDIAGRCALEQTPLEDHFLTKEDFASLAPSLREEGFTCYVAMPLINKAKILGVLEVFERKHHPHDQDWLDFLNALVGQAAIAIDNFQLFDRLQRSNSMLERRVAERTQELHQTNAELERANRAKDEFLATMSHELRTPLNSILGLSESLLEQKRGPLNEPQQKSLQIIESSGRHLLELINDILDLSKIDAGKFDIYPQTIDVDELCQSALAFVRQQAVRKSINLTYEEDQAIAEFQADPRRMKQILVNLLTNAVKFTPEGGRVTLQVHANAEHNLIQFSVIDNGIGIAQKDLKQLFQPFMQVDSSLNRQFEGTGLGLTLVHKLTDLQGGSIQVESEVNKGSRFTVNLPLQRDIADKEQAADPDVTHPETREEGRSVLSASETSKRRAILLAEDNMANTLTLGEYLESHAYKVVFARDGWEAISKAEETNPDLILMDIQMPSLDGLEATRRLRANPRFAKTPIIALTALTMLGDRERCLEAGANEYMSKPVSLKRLVKTIETMLEPGKDIPQ